MNAVPRSLRLGFAGTPKFAVAALAALARSGHGVAAVFTQPDRPSGRGQGVHLSPVKQRALELDIPVHQPHSFKTPDTEALLRSLDLDAMIVVAYGLILPPSVLAATRLGCFNIHASLLPRWRGAAPIQRALLAGDAETGITIMRMEAALDTGPILAARPLRIGTRETAGALHDRLAAAGAELIVESVNHIAAGTAQEVPQPGIGATYADKVDKSEALIDWRQPAARVLRQVCAFNPWPVAETRLDGMQLRVWEAELASEGSAGPEAGALPGTVLTATRSGIEVACGQGALRILRLQLAGRRPLTAQDFLQARPLDGMSFANL